MFGTEVELWEGVLRSSMSMTHSNSIGPLVEPLTAVNRFIGRLGNNGIKRCLSLHFFPLVCRIQSLFFSFIAFPQCVSALMTYVDLSDCAVFPQNFIAVIDLTLFSNYPPRPESLAACLEIIRKLGKMMTLVPRTLLLQLLCAVERGISCWIRDDKAVMLTREHDVVVRLH